MPQIISKIKNVLYKLFINCHVLCPTLYSISGRPGSDTDTAKSPEIMKKKTRLIICMQVLATLSSSSEVNQLFLKKEFATNKLGKNK